MNKAQEDAIVLLEEIKTYNNSYDIINDQLKAIQGDFYTHVSCINDTLCTRVVALLDEILEPNAIEYAIASYYLYECDTMKDGGLIKCCTKTFIIKTIDDVRQYVEHLNDKNHHKQ